MTINVQPHIHNASDRVVAYLIAHRAGVLIGLAILTLAFGALLPRIVVNNDPRSSIPESLPELQTYNRMQSIFNTPRSLLLIAEFDSSWTLTEKTDSMKAWGQRFVALDGIELAMEINSIKVPVSGGLLGMTTDYIVSRKRTLSDEELRERIRANTDFTGAFVSADERAMGMLLNVDESRNQAATAGEAFRMVEKIRHDPRVTVHLTGAALYAYDIDQAMRRDFALLLPLCLLVVSILLYAVFRRIYHVVSSLAIIAIALVWTFGLMALSGVNFSVVTAMIPVILFPIGVASAIYVFKTHARNARAQNDAEPVALIQTTFRELLKPIFLSAVTTFFGFASFAFSKTIWTRNFGIFTSIAVLLALLFSIVILPIVLYGERRHKLDKDDDALAKAAMPAWLDRLYDSWVTGSYRWVLLAALIVTVGIVGFLKVHIEGNPIMMFEPHSEVRQADETISKYLGGTRFMYVVLTRRDGPVTSAQAWREVREIEEHLRTDTLVGATTSLLPLLTRVSGLLSGEDISEAAVSLLIGGKGILGKSFGSYIDAWLSPDRRNVKIALMCRNVAGTPYIALARRSETWIKENYPGWDVITSGPPILNDAMTFALVDTQIQSMTMSLVMVFLILCILFWSIPVGFFSVVPILFSTVFVYALMGFFDIAINTVTIITVNTCIGIGIDYSIHFVSGYFYVRDRHPDRRSAILATVSNKGSAIMFNTFVVGVGFLVLAFSSFPPIRHFGVFVFVSMVASSLFALIFPPALFARFELKSRSKG